MAVFLSLVAIFVAGLAWLAARDSARHSRRAAQVLDREYLAHYAPDLYLWPIEVQSQPDWTWKILNAGRRTALDVRIEPHWGPKWDVAPADTEGNGRPPAWLQVMVLPERAERRVGLPRPSAEEAAGGQLVVYGEWTDPARRERHRRCWLVRRERRSASVVTWTVDTLTAPLADDPACEACPVRREYKMCPWEPQFAEHLRDRQEAARLAAEAAAEAARRAEEEMAWY